MSYYSDYELYEDYYKMKNIISGYINTNNIKAIKSHIANGGKLYLSYNRFCYFTYSLFYDACGCAYPNIEVIKLLIEAGANVNDADGYKDNDTALILLSKSGENTSEIIKMLVDCGADIDKKGRQGWTALQAAIHSLAATKNIKTLMDLGASIDHKIYGTYDQILEHNAIKRANRHNVVMSIYK